MISVSSMNMPADKDISLPLGSGCLMLVNTSGRFAASTVAVMQEDTLSPNIGHGVGAAVFLYKVTPVLTVDHGRVVLGAQ